MLKLPKFKLSHSNFKGYSIRKYSSKKLLLNKDNTKIGWIGTGVMGKHMCSHLYILN